MMGKLAIIVTILTMLTMLIMTLSMTALGRELVDEDGEYIIRVRIAKAHSQVVIRATDLVANLHRQGQRRVYHGHNTVKFKCEQFGKLFRPGEESAPQLLISLRSPTNLVMVGKRNYSYKIHLVESDTGNGCDLVNELPLEEYVAGLLAKEVSPDWPLEALKSQAVAARTYALYMLTSRYVSRKKGFDSFYDLENSERHQVGGSFFDITHKTKHAAHQTAGYILKSANDKLLPTFFHSKCGGRTLPPQLVWGQPVEGYQAVRCMACAGRGKRPWKSHLSVPRFKKFMRWLERKKIVASLPALDGIKGILYPDNWYTDHLQLRIGETQVRFKKSLLRRYFGRKLVPSNNFTVAIDRANKHLSISGRGLGHGVGMCQLGVLGLSLAGRKFKDILKYYFPHYQLTKVY